MPNKNRKIRITAKFLRIQTHSETPSPLASRSKQTRQDASVELKQSRRHAESDENKRGADDPLHSRERDFFDQARTEK